MRAIVGDVLGNFRLINIWNNKTIARAGGNAANEADRVWSCGAILLTSPTTFCLLHSSGAASFCDLGSHTRTGILELTPPARAFSLAATAGSLVACFSGACVSFTESGVVGSFETVPCSCATSIDAHAAYGRIADRTVIYDISQGTVKWTSADPPLDDLRLPLSDDDRSLLFFDPNLLLVGQQGGGVLLYDQRSGPDAVIRAQPFPEFPITALERLRENLVGIGNTIGSLTVMDLRVDDQNLKGHRGFAGAPAGTLQICAHSSQPLFGVLTCDRLVRLYDMTKPLKVATKSGFVRTMASCFVLLEDEMPALEPSSDEEWARLPEDGDEIWDDFLPPERSLTSSVEEKP
jgi:hypothetical protein